VSVLFRLIDTSGGGGTTTLITAAGATTNTGLYHFRVTRTAGNVWKLYYQVVDADGVAGSWKYGGTATDATHTTSDGMFLDYDDGDGLLIGNHRNEKALLKWRGVVNPL
jgi:hypothetical protein